MKSYYLSLLFLIFILSKLSLEQIIESNNNYVAITQNDQIKTGKSIIAEDIEKPNHTVTITPTYIRIMYKANDNIIPGKNIFFFSIITFI